MALRVVSLAPMALYHSEPGATPQDIESPRYMSAESAIQPATLVVRTFSAYFLKSILPWGVAPGLHEPAPLALNTNAQTRLSRFSIRKVDLKCLRSEGGGQAFGLAGEIHGHTILVRQFGVHLALDQGQSAGDAMVGSVEVGKSI